MMYIAIYSKGRIVDTLYEMPGGARPVLPGIEKILGKHTPYIVNPEIANRIYQKDRMIFEFINAAVRMAERAREITAWELGEEFDN